MIDCSMSPAQSIFVSSFGCNPSTSLPNRVLCVFGCALLGKIRVLNLCVCILDSSFVSMRGEFILMMA